MAVTSDASLHTSPSQPIILSPSNVGLPTLVRKVPRTQDASVSSDVPGHVDASYRENTVQKDGYLRVRYGNRHPHAAMFIKNGRRQRYCKAETVGNNDTECGGDEHQGTDDGASRGDNTQNSGRCGRSVSHPATKRFKRGAQQHVCNNEKMHPRSRHKGVFVDYVQFAEKYTFLKPYVGSARSGHYNINFRDPLALYYLSKAILKEFYNLEFELPVEKEGQRYLIPCVPSRANYIHHIADLLVDVDVEAAMYLKGDVPGNATRDEHQITESSICGSATACSELYIVRENTPLTGSSDTSSNNTVTEGAGSVCHHSSVKTTHSGVDATFPLVGRRVAVLDIGVGANCIYPLLGVREYGWRFVGSDVSDSSLTVAKRNVQMNALEENISLRLQPSRENYFVNIVKPCEFYCLTMCNPPFHSSREDVNVCPVRTLEAQDHEIICDGGEVQFILSLIEESKAVCAQVLWFTSLVARATTVKEIKKRLWEELRCFSRESERQEKFMGKLWETQKGSARPSDNRRGGGTVADDVSHSLHQDAAFRKTPRDPSLSPAGEEITLIRESGGADVSEGSVCWIDGVGQYRTQDAVEQVSAEEIEESGVSGRIALQEPLSGIYCSVGGARKSKEGGGHSCEFRVHVSEFRVKELSQGKQTRWVICWTYWTREQRRAVRRSIEDASV